MGSDSTDLGGVEVGLNCSKWACKLMMCDDVVSWGSAMVGSRSLLLVVALHWSAGLIRSIMQITVEVVHSRRWCFPLLEVLGGIGLHLSILVFLGV